MKTPPKKQLEIAKLIEDRARIGKLLDEASAKIRGFKEQIKLFEKELREARDKCFQSEKLNESLRQQNEELERILHERDLDVAKSEGAHEGVMECFGQALEVLAQKASD